MLLDGKVAVVTGSTSGLGRAYARALAKAGARVIINARTADDVTRVVEEIRSEGGIAAGCVASVVTMEGSGRIIQTAIENFGRIDILVNNAGTVMPQLLVDMTEEDFDETIAINLKGTFACTRHAVPYMIKQKWGRIINVSSGAVRGMREMSAYSASKGGVWSMSLTWAIELAEYGITCNVIRASAKTRLTERVKEMRKQRALARGEQPKPEPDMGILLPEVAAPIVVFLAADQSDWINGQYIAIDGPRVALWAYGSQISAAMMPGGWTAELLMEHFKTTVGTRLDDFGWRGPSGKRAL